MLEVYFELDKEAISFCENLFHYNKQIELHWKIHKDWGNQLQLDYNVSNNETMDAVAQSMTDVFTIHRLSAMIKAVIKEYYYYSDKDEIERIMDLTHWIFSGEDEDCQQIRKNKEPGKLLHSLFMASIKNSSTIHYDSIVNFRLKAFKDQVIFYAGLAIDEFKREEDHQAFVNMLREYIVKKESRIKTIHVMQGSTFSFFKPDGKRFSKMELRMLMQKEPLYIVGLDAEEMNLAPLVAMAPEQIRIYGDFPSEPKTLTVINVFQEKVKFLSSDQFPFSYYSRNH